MATPTNEANRVLGYVRVSTDEQARSGLGLADQRNTLTAAALRNGWKLVDVVVDEGHSAKSLDRPGLLSVVDRVVAGEASTIAVAKLDRLTRSLVGLSELLDWSDRLGVALVALDIGLETSTINGRFMARMIATVGEWEREQIADRTRAAAAVRRSAGMKMGRAGVRDTMPDIALRIQDARSGGASWQAIADELNHDEIATVRGGSLWRVSAVQAAAGYIRPAARAKRIQLPEPRRRPSTAGDNRQGR